MDSKTIRNYLKAIVDLENNRFLQQNLERDLEYKISRLGIKREIPEPTILRPEELDEQSKLMLKMSPILLVIGCVTFYLLFFKEYPGSLPDFDWKIDVLLGLCILAMGCISICIIITSILFFIGSFDSSSYATATNLWKAYDQDILDEQKRLKAELVQKEYLERQLLSVKDKRRSTEKKLSDAYALGIIFPKYRNFVMVSSLYEYFCSGRCESLDGPGGAYNILEMELRLDKIIGKLDQILLNLNRIKSNQHMLHGAIEAANHERHDLIQNIERQLNSVSPNAVNIENALHELQSQSEIQNYILQQTQKELEYMNNMNYWAGNYGTGIYRSPLT